MRPIIIALIASICVASSASAHIVLPLFIQIYFKGGTATFNVADQMGCYAKLVISVENPSIVSVDPMQVVAIHHTFNVKALKGGTTKIKVEWTGQGDGCNDIGSQEIDVVVYSGPDLTLEQDALPRTMRVGDGYDFTFTVRNIGDERAEGKITLRNPLAGGFQWTQADRGVDQNCHGTPVVECDYNVSIEANGGWHWLRRAIFFTAIGQGFHSNFADILFNSDVRLTNNRSDTRTVFVEPPRPEDVARWGFEVPRRVSGRQR
jgi:hypothetical protein